MDVTETRSDPATRILSLRSAEIHVVKGPDEGVRVRIDGPTFTIGSGADAHLRLADSGVSREHVRLAMLPDGIEIKDAGSKNGTWIGTMRVDRAVVSADVVLTIGDSTIEIRVDAARTPITISDATEFGDAIGVSAAMRHVFAYLERAASADVTVLLEGENGVGKEVLASGLHTRSQRATGPFVPVDCGAIPANLVESELFGHERGAFTGAERTHVGMFQQANGGTLFLDEIGELPLELQPKLLRALEQREIRAVGSTVSRPVDIRVVAATNRNLKELVQRGAFREDLFYRLAVARIRVPPLRERADDVVPLATRFLAELTGVPEAALPRDVVGMFRAHTWPGNVRELKNAVRRFALLGARDRTDLLDEMEARAHGSAVDDLSHLPLLEARRRVVERLEAAYFPAVLARVSGNISKAAEHAGIARSSFYRVLDRTRGEPGEDDDAT
jgi:transcriptional regulator with PAS, ATPase and Fis domain